MFYKTLFLPAVACAVLAAEAPFEVREYLNQARAGEGVSVGVPFMRGEVADLSGLRLESNGSALPVQLDPLVRFEDGSCQWVLASFTTSLAGNETKGFSLKTGTPAGSSSPAIQVTRAGSKVEVNNGALRFTIDTADFKGIEALSLNGTSIASGRTGGIFLNDLVHGSEASNGPVTKAGFVYLGPIRATLRVEGEFYREACGGMGYSYMVTTYAGSPQIKIEVQIRNAINASCGRLAKIRHSHLVLPLAFTPSAAAAETSGVSGFGNGTVGFTAADRWAGGYYSEAFHRMRVNGSAVELDVVKDTAAGVGYYNGVFNLMDTDVKNSEFTLEFYAGSRSASETQLAGARLKSRLVGRVAPATMSASAALTAGRFGTLEDEEAAYRKWGWTFTDAQKPKSALKLNAGYMHNAGTHDFTEADNAEGLLLQWVRTGERGFFDEGEAYARHYKTHYCWRTVGFNHDGKGVVFADVNGAATRTTQTVGGEPDLSTAMFIQGRIDCGQWTFCHTYGAGLADYYCMTGDIDALEGFRDLFEIIHASFKGTRGGPGYFVGDRGGSRVLLLSERAAEIFPGDTLVRNFTQRLFTNAVRSPAINPWGFVQSPIGTWHNWMGEMNAFVDTPDSLKRYVQSNRITLFDNHGDVWARDSVSGAAWQVFGGGGWFNTWLAPAFDLYFRRTGDEDARDLLIGFGQFSAEAAAGYCGQMASSGMVLNYPRRGMYFNGKGKYEWDPNHAVCLTNHCTVRGCLANATHDGWYSRLMVSSPALAYRYTGFPYLLKSAYTLWNKGSKRGYYSDYFYAPENQVLRFAYHEAVEQDALNNTHQLFFESAGRGDTVPPQVVADLSVSRTAGNTGLVFSWTAPSDNGPIASYQVKISKGRPIADYPEYRHTREDTVRVPWWRAQNVSAEPVPASPGSPESFILTGTFPVSEVWYAAVRSRDAQGNLSPMSNVVTIDQNIGVERKSASPGYGLAASPNPFNPVVTLSISVPRDAGQTAVIAVFDVSGKLVSKFQAQVRGGRASVVWNGRHTASGVYAVHVMVGDRLMVKKIVLSK